MATAIYYQIQVSKRDDFSGEIVWDSGKSSMSPVADGERCQDIEYGGSPLADGTTYYWRIKFWDDDDNVSPWSEEEAYFRALFTPTAPTGLLCNGETNPTNLEMLTPYFSAIYNDPNVGDIAKHYRIQVNTESDFTGDELWDSGKTPMSDVNEGERCGNINYAGATLAEGTTYYWRIKFWDDDDNVSPWSEEEAYFRALFTPTAPTGLLCNGETNPTNLEMLTPYFSAIYNDPNVGDIAKHYRLQVSRRSNFSGEIVWDTGKCSMSPVADGERCQDIEYGGSGLALDGTTYYWRIRFWDDDDNVSPWSTETAYFTMAKEEEVVPPLERENPVNAVGKVKRARLPLLTRRRQLTWSRLITPPTRVILDP